MVLDKDSNKPIALVTDVTGCPTGWGIDDDEGKGNSRIYRDADDSFTLIQLLNNS